MMICLSDGKGNIMKRLPKPTAPQPVVAAQRREVEFSTILADFSLQVRLQNAGSNPARPI